MKTHRHRRKAKVRMIEFLRPGHNWPGPYSVEMAFEVLGAMARTDPQWRKGRRGVRELLSMSPSCLGFRGVDPITSLDDLRERFHYALLAHAGEEMEAWRQATGFHVAGEPTIEIPHYPPFRQGPYEGLDCERAIKDAVWHLFSRAKAGRLAAMPNSTHRNAVERQGIGIGFEETGARIDLRYGVDGSSWTLNLARTRKGESFLDVFHRATEAFDLLTDEVVPQRWKALNALLEDDYHFWIETPHGSVASLAYAGDRDPKRLGKARIFGGLIVHAGDGSLIASFPGEKGEYRCDPRAETFVEEADKLGDWSKPTPCMKAAAKAILDKGKLAA